MTPGRALAGLVLIFALAHAPFLANSLEDMIDTACDFASSQGFAEEGQRIIITVGVPLAEPGATNTLRLLKVGPGGHAEGLGEL
mgnify:CR=1 FL=1